MGNSSAHAASDSAAHCHLGPHIVAKLHKRGVDHGTEGTIAHVVEAKHANAGGEAWHSYAVCDGVGAGLNERDVVDGQYAAVSHLHVVDHVAAGGCMGAQARQMEVSRVMHIGKNRKQQDTDH